MSRWFFGCLLLLALPGAAHADLRLCNRTSYILYAATGEAAGPMDQVRGWLRIAPGDCQAAITGPLAAKRYLVYARSALAHSGPQRAWGGSVQTCVRDGTFLLKQPRQSSCTQPGSYAAPFAAVNLRGRADFTMNFDEQPAFGSLPAAQLAGAKRLLKDNGFALGAIDGAPDKATGKALSAFRQRVHLSDQAGNAELFTALEQEAQKKVAPAGYTVCNDGKAELLVATADKGAKGIVAHGWWRIAAGACARTATQALNTDTVWLLAEKMDGSVVMGGPDQFCVAPETFDLPQSGNCVSRAGFARTPTKGRSFYVAHIGS
jgi:uncharacterized membrane protein